MRITPILAILLIAISLVFTACSSTPPTPTTSPPTPTPTPVESNNQYNIDENYYLSLVKSADGKYAGAADGNLIVLINNKEAKDPTYNELIEFLKKDWTDSYISMGFGIAGFIYGDPWDSVEIEYYKDWIKLGTKTPEAIFYVRYPMNHPLRERRLLVCADFAEVLHNNAELFGIKAAWVAVDFEEEGPGHALNAFRTTDRSLVFIDCTGQSFEDAWKIYGKPASWDKFAHVEVGLPLTFSLLYLVGTEAEGKITLDNPRPGPWKPMGTVKSIEIYWH